MRTSLQGVGRGPAARRVCLAWVLLLGWAAAPRGLAAPRIGFRTSAEVPEEGLALRIFRGAEAEGLPLPPLRGYRLGAGRREECYAPRDLWMAEQFLGRWKDNEGNRLVLGRPASYLPRFLPVPYVTREQYRRAAASVPGVPGDAASLRRWAADFAGAAPEGEPRAVPGGTRLGEVYAYRFASDAGTRAGYAFRFRPNPFGIDPGQWFFALFELPGQDPDEALQLLEREFLPTLALTARGRGTEASARFSRDGETGAAASGDRRANRREVVNSIRGMEDWWYVETPHYLLVSDLPGSRASVVRRIQDDIEYLRAAYAHLVPPFRPVGEVSTLRIFSEGGAYRQYVGAALAWSGGVWMPARRELVVRAREGGSVRDQKAWLVEAVYHEAFHQYLFYALAACPTSAWYNEGHAAFFEGAEIRRGRLEIDESPRHARRAAALARAGFGGLRRLLGFSYADFYGPPETAASVREDHYALAWALVYYLRKAAPLEPSNGYEAIPGRYLEALRTTRDPDRATAAAFAGTDPAALADAMTAFWSSTSRRSAARRYDLFQDYRPAP